jgi:peptidoglycan/LPS O-acetylase OafA/YrhL
MDRTLDQTKHYLALDGLRGVAALAVVCLHATLFFRLGFIPYHAYLAVDFFFMLSGFVIAHAYDRRLAGGLSLGRFLTIRLIRLYPLVLLGIVLGTIALLAATRFTSGLSKAAVLQAAVTNALLLPSPAMLNIRPSAFPTDGPLWSLAFEIWINVLYALCFRFLGMKSLGVALIIGAVLTCWTALTYGGLNDGFVWSDFYLGGARVLFPFVAGVLLSRVMRHREDGTSWSHLAFLPLLVVLVAPRFFGGVYDALAVLVVFPVVLAVAADAPPRARLDAIWRWLGALSYPLYVLHYPFIVVLSNLAHQKHVTGVALDLAAGGTVVFVIVFASLALRLYDMPVRRFLSGGLARRSRGWPGQARP